MEWGRQRTREMSAITNWFDCALLILEKQSNSRIQCTSLRESKSLVLREIVWRGMDDAFWTNANIGFCISLQFSTVVLKSRLMQGGWILQINPIPSLPISLNFPKILITASFTGKLACSHLPTNEKECFNLIYVTYTHCRKYVRILIYQC